MLAGALPDRISLRVVPVIMVILFQDIMCKYNQSNMPQTWGESCTLHYFLLNILLLLILQTKPKFASQAKDQQQPVQPVTLTFMPRQFLGDCWSQLIFFEYVLISSDVTQ